ncbi:MAG: DUF480 domain-containing protein [Steroidobacteraceae bacterium]
MIPQLSPLEARVIGSLIEKQITTPDQYPLSLNALLLACNQKSNRDPMLELTDGAVQELLDALMRKHLVLEKSGFGSRVPKYQQRFCNTEFSNLQFTPQERAVVCELLLRGPQTPGELRTRAARMADIDDVAQVEAALEHLARFEAGACVVRLPREPGRRDARYAHLFSGEPQATVLPAASSAAAPVAAGIAAASSAATAVAAAAATTERLAALEQQVEELRAEVRSLRAALQSATARP